MLFVGRRVHVEQKSLEGVPLEGDFSHLPRQSCTDRGVIHKPRGVEREGVRCRQVYVPNLPLKLMFALSNTEGYCRLYEAVLFIPHLCVFLFPLVLLNNSL